MPGFTEISMYPKLFEQVGIKYSDLFDDGIIKLLKEEDIQNNIESFSNNLNFHKPFKSKTALD